MRLTDTTGRAVAKEATLTAPFFHPGYNANGAPWMERGKKIAAAQHVSLDEFTQTAMKHYLDELG